MRRSRPLGGRATHGEHYTGSVRATQEKTYKKPELTRFPAVQPYGPVSCVTIYSAARNTKLQMRQEPRARFSGLTAGQART